MHIRIILHVRVRLFYILPEYTPALLCPSLVRTPPAYTYLSYFSLTLPLKKEIYKERNLPFSSLLYLSFFFRYLALSLVPPLRRSRCERSSQLYVFSR